MFRPGRKEEAVALLLSVASGPRGQPPRSVPFRGSASHQKRSQKALKTEMARPVGTNRAGLKIGASVGGEARRWERIMFAPDNWTRSAVKRFTARAKLCASGKTPGFAVFRYLDRIGSGFGAYNRRLWSSREIARAYSLASAVSTTRSCCMRERIRENSSLASERMVIRTRYSPPALGPSTKVA